MKVLLLVVLALCSILGFVNAGYGPPIPIQQPYVAVPSAVVIKEDSLVEAVSDEDVKCVMNVKKVAQIQFTNFYDLQFLTVNDFM
ncbi:hypothetical protein M3Y96_00577800 [Aphelenchoides besseyi]|nr:hypothetical protein M3Y96_00577800 [Aphelenchoides besseyi]